MSFFKKNIQNLDLTKTDLEIQIVNSDENESIDEEELDIVFSSLYVKNILEEDASNIIDNQFKREKNKDIDKVHVPTSLSEKRKNKVLEKIEDAQRGNKQKVALIQEDISFSPFVILIKTAIPYFLTAWISYKYGAGIGLLNTILIYALLFSSDDLITFLNKDLPEEELDIVESKFLLDRQLFIHALSISFFVSAFRNVIVMLIVFVVLFVVAAMLGNIVRHRCVMICNVYDQVLEFVKENLNKDADM